MKKLLAILFFSVVIVSSSFAQSDKIILYASVDALHGVRGNGLNYGAGLNAKLQYPIAPNLALTARVGAEHYKIAGYSYGLGYPTLGYGYNLITGWGFNTPQYQVNTFYYETRGTSLPLTVGVRYYVPAVLNGLHVDMNGGVDAAVSETLRNSVRLEPNVGYTLSLGNGHFLDLSLAYFNALKPRTGVIGLSVAYGIPVKF